MGSRQGHTYLSIIPSMLERRTMRHIEIARVLLFAWGPEEALLPERSQIGVEEYAYHGRDSFQARVQANRYRKCVRHKKGGNHTLYSSRWAVVNVTVVDLMMARVQVKLVEHRLMAVAQFGRSRRQEMDSFSQLRSTVTEPHCLSATTALSLNSPSQHSRDYSTMQCHCAHSAIGLPDPSRSRSLYCPAFLTPATTPAAVQPFFWDIRPFLCSSHLPSSPPPHLFSQTRYGC